MAGENDSQEEGGSSGNDSPRKVGADDEGQPKKKKVNLNVSGLHTILTELNGNMKMRANAMLNFREEKKIEMATKADGSELGRKATAAMFDEIMSGVAKLRNEQDEFKREFGKKCTEGDEGDATSGSKENVRGAVNFAAALKKGGLVDASALFNSVVPGLRDFSKHLESVPTKVLSELLVSLNFQIPNHPYRKGADMMNGSSIKTIQDTVTRYAVGSLFQYVLAKGVPEKFPFLDVMIISIDWNAMNKHTAASRCFSSLYRARCLDRKIAGIAVLVPMKVMLLSVEGVPNPLTLYLSGDCDVRSSSNADDVFIGPITPSEENLNADDVVTVPITPSEEEVNASDEGCVLPPKVVNDLLKDSCRRKDGNLLTFTATCLDRRRQADTRLPQEGITEFVLPDLVAECLLKLMLSQMTMNKIRKTKGWAIRTFFGFMLRGSRASFEYFNMMFNGCVIHDAGMVRRAKTNTLEDDEGSVFGVYRYSSAEKAHASNNEFWDLTKIQEHNFVKFFNPVARTGVVETDKATEAKDALLSSFQELDWFDYRFCIHCMICLTVLATISFVPSANTTI